MAQTQADINLNPEAGTLTFRIDLRSEKDLDKCKIFTYGVLKLVEDKVSRYFMVEEMKSIKAKEMAGLVKPNGVTIQ